MISQALVLLAQVMILLLMLDAGLVATGLARKKNMWRWIVLYWLILTVKNAVDAVGSVM